MPRPLLALLSLFVNVFFEDHFHFTLQKTRWWNMRLTSMRERMTWHIEDQQAFRCVSCGCTEIPSSKFGCWTWWEGSLIIYNHDDVQRIIFLLHSARKGGPRVLRARSWISWSWCCARPNVKALYRISPLEYDHLASTGKLFPCLQWIKVRRRSFLLHGSRSCMVMTQKLVNISIP